TILRRHESLRSRIVLIDNTPNQQVDAPQECRLEPIPIGSAGDAHEYLSAFFSSYLDLSTGPLIETRLLRVSEDEHILAVAIHHVVTDAMSIAILFRELRTLYHRYISGRPATLDPVRMQYPEYATSQRNEERQWIETHAPYWKTRLHGADRPRF